MDAGRVRFLTFLGASGFKFCECGAGADKKFNPVQGSIVETQ